jgi:hypothetical protein
METRSCKNCSKNFTIEPDDFSFYDRMQVPPPTLCPLCRQKRRMFVRNFRTLYRRPSSKSGKMIISMYHEQQPFPVWSTEEWNADDWDGTEYGRDFDFSRPFFDQYKELLDTVPRYSLMMSSSCVDCHYCNIAAQSSGCYFVFGCANNEDCDYGHVIWNSRESNDCLYLYKSEYCYECTDVLESNQLLYCRECENCSESIGLLDCRGCINCIGCVGLRNKSYHIFNQQVTKEEYLQFLAEHPLDNPKTIEYILGERDNLHAQTPTPHMFGSHNVDVSGNHIYNAKNVHYSFDVKSGENSKFGFTIRKMIDSYDTIFSLDVENCYETVMSYTYGLIGCHMLVDCTLSSYSQFCANSNNIFGCNGLRKKDYCILNKQYTKEEYEALMPKIIEHMKSTGEWGEFFPIELAPFTYNESTVGEYYPLARDKALALGYAWKDDIEEMRGKENTTIDSISLDERYSYAAMKDKIFACESCKRNYRLNDHELSVYARFKLGLPRNCYFCRHQARMNARMPRELFHRTCMCSQENHGHEGACSNEFETNFSPERPEVIYCEKCYQKEVV